MSVQLTVEQETELADVARQTSRTPDEVAQEAVAQFLASIVEHRAAVPRGRDEVQGGRTIEHEEVFRQLKQRMGW